MGRPRRAREAADADEGKVGAAWTAQMERGWRRARRTQHEGNGEQGLHPQEAGFGAGMQPAVVADALEPGGQHVLQEPVQERGRVQRAGFGQAGVRLGVGKADAAVLSLEQTRWKARCARRSGRDTRAPPRRCPPVGNARPIRPATRAQGAWRRARELRLGATLGGAGGTGARGLEQEAGSEARGRAEMGGQAGGRRRLEAEESILPAFRLPHNFNQDFRTCLPHTAMRPNELNHALQPPAAGHRGCNRRAWWPPSLSVGARVVRFFCARPPFDFHYDPYMPITLSLNEMTVPEKLQVMEALWEDLSRRADAFESPEWHRDVLEDRERRIASGEASFTDWEQAKADIRKQVA